mmetsp:Transcript_30093/g.27485  ORF Transcript_30093/g.27485 Transcript_30093/m.27485 type:complete len:81 (+) Transcript_30093:494-736(+)
MVIKSLIITLHIDIINFTSPHPECNQIIKEIFEKVLNSLSSLLTEFLEVSRYMNTMSRFEKYGGGSGAESNILEDKYLRL